MQKPGKNTQYDQSYGITDLNKNKLDGIVQ